MKLSRLLAYGVVGIVSGLLVENSALVLKARAKDKSRRLQKKANKIVKGLGQHQS